MKNIHVLPTKKPSKLYFNHNKGFEKYQFSKEPFINGLTNTTNQHIYITSDEEIKEGDWCILLENHYVNGGIGKYNTEKAIGYGLHNTEFFKKIILTTDPDLIKDGVQAIDDEFLEWFVKNPSCEFIKIYYKCDKSACYLKEWNTCCKEAKPVLTFFVENESKAKYFREQEIIPKEEPTFENSIDNTMNIMSIANSMFGKKEEPKQKWDINTCRYWDVEIGCEREKCICENQEPKQETLEEAAERISKSHSVHETGQDDVYQGVIQGAKWQAERMYSEEDMRKSYIAGLSNFKKRLSYNLLESELSFEEWFEQFKKK